ncbi:MAG: hypothetical protein ACOCRK_09410 [bacterium]
MKEYQSREYCRDTDCMLQKAIGNNLISKEFAKKYCYEKCEAYKFHQWLKDNGYKIIKPDEKKDNEWHYEHG